MQRLPCGEVHGYRGCRLSCHLMQPPKRGMVPGWDGLRDRGWANVLRDTRPRLAVGCQADGPRTAAPKCWVCDRVVRQEGVDELGPNEAVIATASWTLVDDRLARWQARFEDVFVAGGRPVGAGRFPSPGLAVRAGLLSDAERKNSRMLAEQAGDLAPDGSMQRLLNFYRWDTAGVRDDLRGYVLDNLGDPTRVVVADETEF